MCNGVKFSNLCNILKITDETGGLFKETFTECVVEGLSIFLVLLI